MAKIREHIANTSLVFLCIVPYGLPTHKDWPRPTAEVCHTDSYVSVPDLDTTPTKDHMIYNDDKMFP